MNALTFYVITLNFSAINGIEQKQGPVIILGPLSIMAMEWYVSTEPIVRKRLFLLSKATINWGSCYYFSMRLVGKKHCNQRLRMHIYILNKTEKNRHSRILDVMIVFVSDGKYIKYPFTRTQRCTCRIMDSLFVFNSCGKKIKHPTHKRLFFFLN